MRLRETDMSVYHVVQWSVSEPDADACGKAVEVIAEHVRAVHPAVASLRTYRQTVGPLPLRTYFVFAEYESLTAMDADPDTPACDEVWSPVFAAAQPGTFVVSIWSDPQRASWFER